MLQPHPTPPEVSPPVDFVIVTALEEEREAVLAKLPEYRKLPPSEHEIWTYYSSNLPVTFPDHSIGSYQIVVTSFIGMGRVQAATATGDAIRRWRPQYIILAGIAGGVAENKVKLGDIVISTQIADYELQKVFDEKEPQIRWEVHQASPRLISAALNFKTSDCQALISQKRPGRGRMIRHLGPIASGDKVMAAKEVLARYRSDWPKLIGIEMEAGGVATAAFQAAQRPEFFMVRAISDLADKEKNTPRVEKWRAYACDIAASYTIALLKSGPVPSLQTPAVYEPIQAKPIKPTTQASSSLLPTNAPKATLIMRCRGQEKYYRLQRAITRLGRARDCELEIPDACDNVERYHASILYKEGQFVITDGFNNMATQLGTYINRIQVKFDVPIPLHSGDQIVLGGFRKLEIGELTRGACELTFKVEAHS